MKKYYQLLQTGREAEIIIYGDITSWTWDESDVSSYTLAKEIAGLDVDVIHVYINSYGGELAEGLAIRTALRRHKAKIITYNDGFACSAASIIFAAGDERVMSDASLLMLHNVWTYASGNADELRKVAEDLDAMENAYIKAYLESSKLDENALREMLAAETWLAPQQALEMGFATSVAGEPSGKDKKPNQSIRSKVFALLWGLPAQPDTGTIKSYGGTPAEPAPPAPPADAPPADAPPAPPTPHSTKTVAEQFAAAFLK